MDTEPEKNSFDLVHRAQLGDPAALESLIERHLPSLRAFVRAKSGPALRRQESSSDLVQTVCREALQSLGKYQWQGEGSFRRWLFTLAVHKLRGKVKYYGAERRAPDREERPADEQIARVYQSICSPSQHAIANEVVHSVEAALDQLDAGQREVFLMSKVMGMSHRDIAAELGKNEDAVRSQLSRALTRLSAVMQQAERAARAADD